MADFFGNIYLAAGVRGIFSANDGHDEYCQWCFLGQYTAATITAVQPEHAIDTLAIFLSIYRNGSLGANCRGTFISWIPLWEAAQFLFNLAIDFNNECGVWFGSFVGWSKFTIAMGGGS